MDSNGFIQQRKERKSLPVTEGGLKISRDEEEIKKARSSSELPDPFEVQAPDQKTAKKKVSAHKKIETSLMANIDDDVRSVRLSMLPNENQKNAVRADMELRAIGKTIVRNGSFSDDQLNAGLNFMKKVDEWAGINGDPDEDERAFYDSLGSADTVDYLYVDGKPLKDFVSEKYGYTGSNEDVNQTKAVLSAYAAMISYRQNHAITMVRPTYKDGHADVDIIDLAVNMENFNKSRSDKVKGVKRDLNGSEYVRRCEASIKPDMRAKAAKAARNITNTDIEAMNKLDMLKAELKAAGRGKHQNYDDFTELFNRYFDSLVGLTSSPENMKIGKAALEELDRLSNSAIKAANDYLKGKKMNLPRHKAVLNIREYLRTQTAAFWGALRSGAVDNDHTVSLADLLDKPAEEGFTVVGIEDEIDTLKQAKENNAEDKNEYEVLGTDAGLTEAQKTTLKLKSIISKDDSAREAYLRVLESVKKRRMPEKERIELSREFILFAAEALWADEGFKKEMKDKYPGNADDDAVMIDIIAQTQIAALYPEDFKKIPALNIALDMRDENIVLKETQAMTYQSKPAENSISKEEFDKTGGTMEHCYVPEKEADEAVKASFGFLAKKQVPGHKGVAELVPSMPEYTTLSKGKKTEKRIPLRKTLKTMFKTIAYMMTDEKGVVKSKFEKFQGTDFGYCIDDLFTLDAGANEDKWNESMDFIKEVILPAMTQMLENEYKQKKIKGYKEKSEDDAVKICQDFVELIKGCDDGLLPLNDDFSINNFLQVVNCAKKATVDEIMKHRSFANFKIDGRNFTAKEVEEALKDIKAELSETEAEVTSIKNMDADDEMMPGFSTGVLHVAFNQRIVLGLVDNKTVHTAIDYKYKFAAQEDPEKALDTMSANLDNIVDIMGQDEKKTADIKKKINELSEKRKTEELSKKDKNDIKSLYNDLTKYEIHRTANMGKVGNIQYTSESFAAIQNNIIKSPFTNKIRVGRYVTDKPYGADSETGRIIHDSVNRFYNHDDAFAHCKTRKDVIKAGVINVIREMSRRYKLSDPV